MKGGIGALDNKIYKIIYMPEMQDYWDSRPTRKVN